MNNNIQHNLMTIGTIAILTLTVGCAFIGRWSIEKTKDIYKKQLEESTQENAELKKELNKFKQFGLKVDVTMYRPTRIECDNDPNILADGTKIKIKHASKYQYVAVSRNLLKRWGGFLKYGDFILLKPPIKVSTLALWVLPFIFLLIGIFIVFWHNKKSKKF